VVLSTTASVVVGFSTSSLASTSRLPRSSRRAAATSTRRFEIRHRRKRFFGWEWMIFDTFDVVSDEPFDIL
jgi:hypothetical protein